MCKGTVVCHSDPHIRYVPSPIMHFVLRVFAPFAFKQMQKVPLDPALMHAWRPRQARHSHQQAQGHVCGCVPCSELCSTLDWGPEGGRATVSPL